MQSGLCYPTKRVGVKHRQWRSVPGRWHYTGANGYREYSIYVCFLLLTWDPVPFGRKLKSFHVFIHFPPFFNNTASCPHFPAGLLAHQSPLCLATCSAFLIYTLQRVIYLIPAPSKDFFQPFSISELHLLCWGYKEKRKSVCRCTVWSIAGRSSTGTNQTSSKPVTLLWLYDYYHICKIPFSLSSGRDCLLQLCYAWEITWMSFQGCFEALKREYFQEYTVV